MSRKDDWSFKSSDYYRKRFESGFKELDKNKKIVEGWLSETNAPKHVLEAYKKVVKDIIMSC